MFTLRKIIPVVAPIGVALSLVVFGIFLIDYVGNDPFAFPQMYFEVMYILVAVQSVLQLKRYYFDEKVIVPNSLLIPSEEIRYVLGNVWVSGSAHIFPIGSWQLYKTHIVITNKRVLLAANYFGRLKFVEKSSLWFKASSSKATFLSSLGDVEDVSFDYKNEPILLISGGSYNLHYKIYTDKAEEIANTLSKLVEKA
jgi:hypothetical protein